jgi:hypothetical protein
MRLLPHALLLATMMGLASCSGDGPTGGGGSRVGPPSQLTVVSGDAQTAVAGSRLTSALVIKVSDAGGKAVSGATVAWAVASGGGSLSASSASTDPEGLARVEWTLGTSAGPQSVTATVASVAPATFTARATAGEPARLEKTKGDAQTGTAGGLLADSLAVRVSDANGNPVSGATITWTVTLGGGSLGAPTSSTDSAGLARALWTVGKAIGANQATATVGALPAQTFTATGRAGPAAGLARVSGDGQTGATSAALPSPLVVKVTDLNGNPVGGVSVAWQVTAGGGSATPGIATSDTAGLARATWTLGSAAGMHTVNALAAGATVGFSATATTAGGASLESIAPAILTPGATATLTGSGFASTPGANSVTVDGVPATVTAASPTQMSVVLPARSSFRCEPTRSVVVSVTVNGASAGRSHPLQVATQRSLEVGESLMLLEAADVRCNELSRSSGRYVLSVFNTSTTLSATSAFQLRGAGAAAFSASALRSAAVRPSPSLSKASAPGDVPGHGAHARLLEQNRELLRRLAPTFTRSPALPRLSRSAAAPLAVGDTLRVRIADRNASNLCQSFTEVTARVVYAGTRAVVLEDRAAPLAGQMDEDYQTVGREFDSRMMGILEANFGNPLAVDAATDNNGKILMVFSKVVNDSKGVAGFVFGGDFFPRTSCSSSNQAEIFYAVVPTSAETGYGSGTRGRWKWTMRSTIIHEVKHITSYAERLARNASTFEESWLEESTARVSEELWARVIFGYAQKGNTTYQQSIYCEVRPSWAECSGKPLVMLDHFDGLYDYQSSSETLTPLGRTQEDDWTFYGSGWSLVRWSADHFASSEAAFLKALTQEPRLSGVQNLQARTGRTFSQLLGSWSLAMAVDDHPGFTSANVLLRFPSWNTRDVFGGMNRDFPSSYARSVPLNVRTLSFGTFSSDVAQLRAGSAAVFELSGSQPGRQLIEVRSPTGGDPAPTLRLGIVRVQ